MADGSNGNKWKSFLDISVILYYHKNDQSGVTGSPKISKKLLKNMPGKPLRYVQILCKMPGAMMKGAMDMKRFMGLISTVLLLVIVFAVPVSAYVHTSEETCYFMESFKQDIYSDGQLAARFQFTKGFPDGVLAGLYLCEECTTGRTFVQISCDNIEIRTASSHQIVDNIITCGTSFTHAPYTSKTNHYAIRECNGIILGWDCYHISPTHSLDSVLDPSDASEVE